MADKEIFERGLDSAFVERLNSVGEGDWWKNVLQDHELFVGIRENYLNVYFHGNSLVKLRMLKRPAGCLSGSTHKKYLGLSGDGYITSRDGKFIFNDACGAPKSLSGLTQLKNQSREKKCSREKSAIQNYLEKTENVVDLEIAVSTDRNENFTPDPSGSKMVRLPRVDILQLCKKEEARTVYLNFIEAKHIKDDGLVTNGDEPKVITQIKQYQNVLKNRSYNEKFKKIYLGVCKNLTCLGLTKHAPLATGVTNGTFNLEVNPNPQLLVFLTKELRANWITGVDHQAKLVDCLRKISCEYIPYPI